MSERLDTSLDHIGIIADTARAITAAADMDRVFGGLADTIDNLPAELMTGFTPAEGQDAEQASAVYAGMHLRTIVDLVELQKPEAFSDHAIVERFVHAYDRTHGLQSWDWLGTFVRTALPSQFERLYEPTLTRLAGLASAKRREGKIPQPTPWVKGLEPVVLGNTPMDRGRAMAASRWAGQEALRFYDVVVGEGAVRNSIPPSN